ncbi:MAG: HAD family hydrolase [Actinobacteria bacterium]|nr:HAD family hydrolase [Actinomycetota bacterium]
MAPALTAVLFDLDDTLADSTGVEERIWHDVAAIIEQHFPAVDRTALRIRYLEALERWYPQLAAGAIDMPTFRRSRLQDALEPWGALTDELVQAYTAEKARIADELQVVPGAVEVLRLLRGRGVRVGILTNGPSEFQRRKLASSRLGVEVDAIAISGELGVAKPEAEAFAGALALLGADAASTAMVGDSLANDVHGSIDAGLAAAVWLPGRQAGEPPRGALVAGAVTEVPRLLGLE